MFNMDNSEYAVEVDCRSQGDSGHCLVDRWHYCEVDRGHSEVELLESLANFCVALRRAAIHAGEALCSKWAKFLV